MALRKLVEKQGGTACSVCFCRGARVHWNATRPACRDNAQPSLLLIVVGVVGESSVPGVVRTFLVPLAWCCIPAKASPRVWALPGAGVPTGQSGFLFPSAAADDASLSPLVGVHSWGRCLTAFTAAPMGFDDWSYSRCTRNRRKRRTEPREEKGRAGGPPIAMLLLALCVCWMV